MYCRYCGKEIDNDSKFCQYCGKVLTEKKKLKQCAYCQNMVPELSKIGLCPDCQTLYDTGEIVMIKADGRRIHSDKLKECVYCHKVVSTLDDKGLCPECQSIYGSNNESADKICIYCGQRVSSVNRDNICIYCATNIRKQEIDNSSSSELETKSKIDSYEKVKRDLLWSKYNSKHSDLSTKWMNRFIKYFVPFACFFGLPVIGFVQVVNAVSTYYNGDWSLFFSYPYNTVIIFCVIVRWICLFIMFYYLKRLSVKGLMALYLYTAIFIIEGIIEFIAFGTVSSMTGAISLIINAIYFYKRRYLFE